MPRQFSKVMQLLRFNNLNLKFIFYPFKPYFFLQTVAVCCIVIIGATYCPRTEKSMNEPGGRGALNKWR